MSIYSLLNLIILLLMIVANGVFAMAEIAVVSARKARLQSRAEDGDRGAQTALELIEKPNRFLSTVQIGITLVGILAGAFGGATIAQEIAVLLEDVPIIGPYGEALGVVVVVVVTTYLSLVIGELVPKRLALFDAEGIASLVARPMKILSRVASPVVRLLTFSTEVILKLIGAQDSGEPSITEEEIVILIEQGIQEGIFQKVEHEIIERVLQMDERRISAVMTPRTDMVWLDIGEAPDKNWSTVIENGYAFYPVYEEQEDRVIGIVASKTLLAKLSLNQPVDLRSMLTPPVYIPDTTPILGALKLFRESRQNMLLVLDERGSLEGLATLDDILEAIVGELPSIDDGPFEAQMQLRDDGSWLVDGLLSLRDLKEVFEIKALPDEEPLSYETLGGFIMARLGKIPVESDHFEWQGYRFEVIDMDGHRVDKVLISNVPGKALK